MSENETSDPKSTSAADAQSTLKQRKVVSLESYMDLAHRTELNASDYITKVVPRLGDVCLLHGFLVSAGHMSILGSQVDLLKRAIFYGKELPEGVRVTLSEAVAQSRLNYDPVVVQEKFKSNIHLTRCLHAIIGIMTEVGELVDSFVHHVYGEKPLDWTNIVEEVGDLMWYVVILFDILRMFGSTEPLTVLQLNIDKLRARYGERFNEFDALVRDLVNERSILEGKSEEVNGVQCVPLSELKPIEASGVLVRQLDQMHGDDIVQVSSRLGKAAWDAYAKAVGGKAFNGDVLPTWEAMQLDAKKQQLVAGWMAAGMAATQSWLASSWDVAELVERTHK